MRIRSTIDDDPTVFFFAVDPTPSEQPLAITVHHVSHLSFPFIPCISTMSDAHSTGYMSEEEQDERRKQIQDIMKDRSMSQGDKSKAIQGLMDGRRRNSIGARSVNSHHSGTSEGDATVSSYVQTMGLVAAAANDYYASDEEGDALMTSPADIYGYDETRSISSSVTHDVAPGTYKKIHGRSFSLQDWNEETRAAAAANMSIFADHPEQVSRLMEISRPECIHYDRKCTIVAPCCGLAFGCRICHDECPVLPPPILFQKDDTKIGDTLKTTAGKQARRFSMPLDLEDEEEENHHAIDRFAIREVLCRECFTRQSSKTYVLWVGCGGRLSFSTHTLFLQQQLQHLRRPVRRVSL